ncbi:NAD(P)H:quinone oxidoreductase [Streptomyces chiangmaiensis]|uniref:NAD(P)H:quinone oxidoreductase n=1 Tax=Streptomyces chiangmaiensis TaxID=766497 RepID=A0ABU7FET7_9ACTN|nr:NAD(P)H:quinone oxidoreductase [Streptomyces chiangmaiensis]MED7822671.1 NAD(P)H:quinone oxidoreductase [Streptomyces chiangmaiensis]
MSEAARVAVIYYSATGSVRKLAEAVAEGAAKDGAEVRLRRVAELAPEAAINSNPTWAQNHRDSQQIPEATLDDLEWADAVVFGSPTRFGLPAAQLKQFLDLTGPLWAQGKLANKVYSSFASAANVHGGQESTILALNNTFYHWGGLIVSTGYTDPLLFQAGGNPYGPSHASNNGADLPDEARLEAARYLGRRVNHIAAALRPGGSL